MLEKKKAWKLCCFLGCDMTSIRDVRIHTVSYGNGAVWSLDISLEARTCSWNSIAEAGCWDRIVVFWNSTVGFLVLQVCSFLIFSASIFCAFLPFLIHFVHVRFFVALPGSLKLGLLSLLFCCAVYLSETITPTHHHRHHYYYFNMHKHQNKNHNITSAIPTSTAATTALTRVASTRITYCNQYHFQQRQQQHQHHQPANNHWKCHACEKVKGPAHPLKMKGWNAVSIVQNDKTPTPSFKTDAKWKTMQKQEVGAKQVNQCPKCWKFCTEKSRQL